MNTEKLPDGTTKYTYGTDWAYRYHGDQINRTMGRHKIIYEGWLNDQLVRIIR